MPLIQNVLIIVVGCWPSYCGTEVNSKMVWSSSRRTI